MRISGDKYLHCGECKLNKHATNCSKLVMKKCEPVNDERMQVDDNLVISGIPKTAYIRNNKQSVYNISQKFKKTNGYFWSGDMTYYTNLNKRFQTHYWKLDSSCIYVFTSNKLEKRLKEIAIGSIVKATLSGVNKLRDDAANERKCLFVLRTENEIYYCGKGNEDHNTVMNVQARNFYNVFKMVHLPYGNNNKCNKRKKLQIRERNCKI